MNYFDRKLIGLAGIKQAHMKADETKVTSADHEHVEHPHKMIEKFPDHVEEHSKNERYTGVPNIPNDIAYNAGKIIGGSRSPGIFSTVTSNPAVIFGLGLTTLALLGTMRRSIMNDKVGTQKFMRYRILAQFFTVSALVAGVTFFATTIAAAPSQKDEKPIVVDSNNGN